MKKISAILPFSSLIACSENKTTCNYITDYYPVVYEAEIQYHQKNYQKAFELYQAAFKSCEPKNTILHNELDKYSELAAILGKEELALELITRRIEQGAEIAWIQQEPVFQKILNSERGKEIVSEYEQNRAEYLAGLNLELRKELQKMIQLDRAHNMTPTKDSMFRANDKRLVEIFEEYGYPNEKLIGSYNIDKTDADPQMMLLHSADSIRINYFIPKIEEFVRNGECFPIVLATLHDNLELFNGNSQTHGTFRSSDGGYAKMISSVAEVNSNRQNAGMPSLEMTEKLDSLRLQ